MKKKIFFMLVACMVGFSNAMNEDDKLVMDYKPQPKMEQVENLPDNQED